MAILIIIGVVIWLALFMSGLRMYIAFALGGLFIILFYSGFQIQNLAVFFFDSINNYNLLGIPLYILAGQFLIYSGMGKVLVNLLTSFTNRVPGGLAVAAILTCCIMGALCGDAFAIMAAVGLVLYPSMMEAKYDRGYSGAVFMSSCQIGVLIPPSLVFIIFGFMTSTSTSRLFIAGILPGLVLTTALIITAIIIAKRQKFPLQAPVSWRERKNKFIKALPALFMPIIVLGGIYTGIFTTTEAAAVAAVYTLLVGAFVYKGLNLKNIYASAVDTSRLVTVILILFCGVMLLNRAFVVLGFPQAIGNFVVNAHLTKTAFLLLLCFVFFLLGFVMDAFAMVALLPTIFPAALAVGVDPLQLGVIFVIAGSIGGITPPAAGFLFFASKLFNIPTTETIRGVMPFLATMVIAMLIFVFFPVLSTWLPSTMIR